MTEREFIVQEIAFRECIIQDWMEQITQSIQTLRTRLEEIDREKESTTPTEEEAI